MTPHDFYLKYWRIKDANGNLHVTDFSAYEWMVFDVAYELDVEPYVRNYARMNKPRFIVNPIVSKEINKRHGI